MLLFFLLFRWGNRGARRSNNLHKVTQLEGCQTRIWTWADSLLNLCSLLGSPASTGPCCVSTPIAPGNLKVGNVYTSALWELRWNYFLFTFFSDRHYFIWFPKNYILYSPVEPEMHALSSIFMQARQKSSSEVLKENLERFYKLIYHKIRLDGAPALQHWRLSPFMLIMIFLSWWKVGNNCECTLKS